MSAIGGATDHGAPRDSVSLKNFEVGARYVATLKGATLSERICAYFKETLGFKDEDLDMIRDIMLEPVGTKGVN